MVVLVWRSLIKVFVGAVLRYSFLIAELFFKFYKRRRIVACCAMVKNKKRVSKELYTLSTKNKIQSKN